MNDFRRCIALVNLACRRGRPGGLRRLRDAGSGRAAEAPAYRVGDRWVYHGQDGFFRLLTTWEETHTISTVGADGIGERITVKGPTLDLARAEQWAAPGLVKIGALYENETRRFVDAARSLPVSARRGRAPGASSSTISTRATKTTGQINNYVRVRGWETVVTPAGTFDAVVMHVVIWLDDETFWRFPTQCNYIVWYAPAVRGIVREIKRATYQEKGGDMDSGARIPTQNTVHRARVVHAGRLDPQVAAAAALRSRGAARSSSSAPPGSACRSASPARRARAARQRGPVTTSRPNARIDAMSSP